MLSPAIWRILLGLFVLDLCISGVECFSWGIDRHRRTTASLEEEQQHLSQPSHAGSQLTNTYSVALNELQELESEPLCHRIAARLLVNNCQLLDGRDEATVHTDSGRAARDFVDSYAASLAICDLERGSFVIPASCSSFRESTLATISIPTKPYLHVSGPQIDSCLEGLAQSDSAWNTWVSYRHKALRFCEAAKAEHSKDQAIHVHQRITKILEKLTNDVEAELEIRIQSLNHAFRDASNSVETLEPQVDRLKSKIDAVGGFMGETLLKTAQESSESIRAGLEDAKNLRQMLLLLLKATMDGSAELSSSHETALQAATSRVDQEMDTIVAVLTAAVASSVSLQDQINVSHLKSVALMENQERMEMGMERLQELANGLSEQFNIHEGRLDKAQEKADEILNTLDSVSISAAGFRNSISAGLGLTGWWPYVLCPVASLVMGSYGLEPSLLRNLWLVGLGEAAGFLVSSAGRYAAYVFPATKVVLEEQGTQLNTTRNMDYLSYESCETTAFYRPRRNKYSKN